MELKHKLEKIFNNDYPGTDRFIVDVIEPIFGNEIEYIGDDIAEREKYAEKAKNAGIKHIKYIGDLTEKNYNADNIALLDVTLDDSKNIERSRVNIQQLIRSIMDYRQHLMIVFHYEDVKDKQWRFSYAYKGDSLKDSTSAKRYTYVFGKGYCGRTAAERFEILAKSPRNDEDFEDAFSVAALSDEFFKAYRAYYAVFVEYITGERYLDEKEINIQLSKFNWLKKDCKNQFKTVFESQAKEVRDYIKKMFGRIVFLYFLQRKGWLYDNNGVGDSRYMKHLFEKAERDGLADTFLDDVLELLFFYVLNTKKEQRVETALADNKNIKIIPGWEHIDFLNGGLFNPDEIDPKVCVFPAIYFKELFAFLDSYNFTIDENDQEDAEVGIDPEMLGRIFENLLEDNKAKGAFYTPKEIVDYMCRESIIAYLIGQLPEINNMAIRNLVVHLNPEQLTHEQQIAIRKELQAVKICDPAIGSGAFPMGLVNLLSKLYVAMKADTDTTKMKRHIMEQNIYGVDIEQGAVDIARLRFWLAMIVEEKDPIPLPNLHFKIMQGNSLLESYNGRDLSDLTKLSTDLKYGESRGLWDTDDAERKSLISSLKSYYKTSDHSERDRLFNNITNNVRRQLFDKGIILPTGEDPSANTDFFLWHTWFADVFEDGGFDIIIGNPPYIKEGRISKRFFEPYKSSPYYKGKMDIWYLFASLGLDLLTQHGILCFIATNNWTTSYGASKLRNKIIKESRICRIIDFGAVMMFESASIQTMIMMFQKDNKTDDYTFDYRRLTSFKATEKDAIEILTKTSKQAEYFNPVIRRSNYIDKSITFSQNDSVFNTICSNSSIIFLKDNEIAQGIVFPQDKLNKKNQQKLGSEFVENQGIFVLDKQELADLELSEHEKALIKPYFTTENIDRYFINPANIYWTIYTDSSYKAPNSLDKFPNIKRHLDRFLTVFTSDNKPYGLHRSREQRFFVNPKIIAVRKSVGRPSFSYCDIECYISQTFNMIQTDRVNMKYLTGLLNSKLIKFWLMNRGKMQGANYQLDKEPLQQIPIIVPAKHIQDLIAKLVDCIIYLKGCVTRISSLVTNDYLVNSIEKLIDGCIAEIYFAKEFQSTGIHIIQSIMQAIPQNCISVNAWELYRALDNNGLFDIIESIPFKGSKILKLIFIH